MQRQLSSRKVTRIALGLSILFLIIFAVMQSSLSGSSTSNPEAARVLVIANRNSPISLRVAQYYMHRRGIPGKHFLTLDVPDSTLVMPLETISYETYQKQVEQPLRTFLERNNLVNHIRYIVLTKGVPLRVMGVPYQLSTGEALTQNQSVDSTLAALDYKIAPIEIKDFEYKQSSGTEIYGKLTPNFYWRQTYPFEHQLTGGYLVTRLDGYTEKDARALVDRALTPRPSLSGSVLIDPSEHKLINPFKLVDIFDPKVCTPQIMPRCSPRPEAMIEANGEETDNDFRLSAQLTKAAFPNLKVVLAPPNTFATGQDLIGYMSWGSNDESFEVKNYHSLQFLPGAIADTVVSSSGRTFFPTPTGQSLIGDLITLKAGVTGIRGYVDEPELRGIGSPSVLFKSYLSGANLATAYYQSIRFVGWRDLVLGDPLATVAVDQ